MFDREQLRLVVVVVVENSYESMFLFHFFLRNTINNTVNIDMSVNFLFLQCRLKRARPCCFNTLVSAQTLSVMNSCMVLEPA